MPHTERIVVTAALIMIGVLLVFWLLGAWMTR